jgi:glycosyltransferase involved in cell wall biosynthesis
VVNGTLRGHAWEQTELPARARKARADVCLSLAGTLPGAGGPHVGVIHDVLPLLHPEWFSTAFAAWYRIAVGRNARRAARLVTVSRWSADTISRTLGISRDRIVIAPQSVSPFDAPATPEAVARVTRELGIAGPYVLATGWGDPRKNVSFLLDVMGEWWRRDSGAPALVVVGRARTRVHGAPDATVMNDRRIYCTGRVDDETLHALYTGAAVFAFPSLAEGYGRPPLEAAACGTPCIAAPFAAAGEVLRDGAHIEPLDVDRWLSALQELSIHGPRREALVARGRAIAHEGSWDAAAGVVLDACAAAASSVRAEQGAG